MSPTVIYLNLLVRICVCVCKQKFILRKIVIIVKKIQG